MQPIIVRLLYTVGMLNNIAAAPSKETNEVKITPNPVAIEHAIPDRRPEPIDVAIVFRTFGPGIKTLIIKKSNAGKKILNEDKKLSRFSKFFRNELNSKLQF